MRPGRQTRNLALTRPTVQMRFPRPLKRYRVGRQPLQTPCSSAEKFSCNEKKMKNVFEIRLDINRYFQPPWRFYWWPPRPKWSKSLKNHNFPEFLAVCDYSREGGSGEGRIWKFSSLCDAEGGNSVLPLFLFFLMACEKEDGWIDGSVVNRGFHRIIINSSENGSAMCWY